MLTREIQGNPLHQVAALPNCNFGIKGSRDTTYKGPKLTEKVTDITEIQTLPYSTGLDGFRRLMLQAWSTA